MSEIEEKLREFLEQYYSREKVEKSMSHLKKSFEVMNLSEEEKEEVVERMRPDLREMAKEGEKGGGTEE